MKHADVMWRDTMSMRLKVPSHAVELKLPIATLKATSLKMNVSTSGIMCKSVKTSFLKASLVLKDPDFWNYTEKNVWEWLYVYITKAKF